MPVHRIDSIDQRNRQPRFERVLLIAIDHVRPAGQRIVFFFLGSRSAAAQQRSEKILLNVRVILERRLIGLAHLPDLFLQRHFGQQCFGLRIERCKRFLLRFTRAQNSAAGEHKAQDGRIKSLHVISPTMLVMNYKIDFSDRHFMAVLRQARQFYPPPIFPRCEIDCPRLYS